MKRNTSQSQTLSFVMRLFTIVFCFTAGGFCLFKSGVGQSIEQPAVAALPHSEKSQPLEQPQFKLKSVSDYQVGDRIMAFNHETGQREQKTVTQTFKRQVDHLRILEVEGEDGSTQTIKTTNEHPFWSTAARDYVEAKHLKPGTKLQGANGHFITVKSTRYEPHPEGITVYNVEVKGPHNYFVAANGYRGPPVLAHNTCNASDLPITNLDDFATKNKTIKNLKNATGSFNIRVKNQKQAEELLASARKRIYDNPKITYGGKSGKVGFEVHGVNSSERRVGNNLPHLKIWDWLDGKSLGFDGHIFFDGIP
ncbi:polymorphic toxin-type HINT domain-containing protein [Gimesia aquarii]|uniref:Uncharacterized protein n=1 Tax=Gimesia aquarii TaxID=2527964 RepID=A0A517WUZ4_9PLAN|nr:polymorphic toxin-type HINT domain-containing protein [Gimesia aquarii]QDU09048.1 hypothetical protein V202x_24190 [Gimesia aquarii]